MLSSRDVLLSAQDSPEVLIRRYRPVPSDKVQEGGHACLRKGRECRHRHCVQGPSRLFLDFHSRCASLSRVGVKQRPHLGTSLQSPENAVPPGCHGGPALPTMGMVGRLPSPSAQRRRWAESPNPSQQAPVRLPVAQRMEPRPRRPRGLGQAAGGWACSPRAPWAETPPRPRRLNTPLCVLLGSGEMRELAAGGQRRDFNQVA